MNPGIIVLREEFGASIAALAGALAAGDEPRSATRSSARAASRTYVFGELRKLTGDLQSALRRFRDEARLKDLAAKEVPDARQRLAHVVKLTDEAAHRTLDLVEQSGPLVERTAREAADIVGLWRQFRARNIDVADFRKLAERMDAFLDRPARTWTRCAAILSEVLLAQGYQDLTGQIIRGVIKLVGELETVLGDWSRWPRRARAARAPRSRLSDETRRGIGPRFRASTTDPP